MKGSRIYIGQDIFKAFAENFVSFHAEKHLKHGVDVNNFVADHLAVVIKVDFQVHKTRRHVFKKKFEIFFFDTVGLLRKFFY